MPIPEYKDLLHGGGDPKKPLIIAVESVLGSWLKDFGSLGSLALLIYVNHVYGSGHWSIDSLGLLLLSLWLFNGPTGKDGAIKHMTPQELKDWVNADAFDNETKWV